MSKLICVGMLESAVYSKMHRIAKLFTMKMVCLLRYIRVGGNTEIKVLIHENEQTDRNI